jgi:putative nucleotidyltransferase with HDIG domain
MELLYEVPIPIMLVDRSLKIVFANRALTDAFNGFLYRQNAPLASFLLHPEEARTVRTLLNKAIAENKTQVREGAMRMCGNLVWARLRCHPMRLDGRDLVMIVMDIRKDVAGSPGSRKYNKLMSIFPIGIAEFSLPRPVSFDLGDNELASAILSAQLVDGNNEFARMHGRRDVAALFGTAVRDFSEFARNNEHLYVSWIRKFFPSGSFEVTEEDTNGEVRNFELTLVGELEDDALTGFWELRRDITNSKLSEKRLRESFNTLKRTLMSTVDAMASVVEKRDPYTAGHQRRVAKLAQAIAREMGLSEDDCTGIHVAASIHDIGKIYVPAEFLSKPGTLSESERAIIGNHPNVGYDILKDIEFPWPIAEILLQHHERLDGSGYPNGLTGDDIMLEARILAVADVVEAMSSHRPYRPSLGMAPAINEIRQYSGIRYDRSVVHACLNVLNKGFSFR